MRQERKVQVPLPVLLTGLLVMSSVFAFPALSPGSSGGPRGQQPPRPLSPAHSEVLASGGCLACHGQDQKVAPDKCMACHQEIASRISAGQGYHRDKAGECAACHAEHPAPGVGIVPLDIKDFDHSETGFVPGGAHKKVTACDRCHRPENSIPRTKSRSYLFKISGCPACHVSPHPGRQDECLACHGQETWTVDRGKSGR